MSGDDEVVVSAGSLSDDLRKSLLNNLGSNLPHD
jgi:hypothetical protein